MKNSKKIVLIDDNDGDALLLREALKRVDESVDYETFQSGEEAIKHFQVLKTNNKSDLPNLIILDLNMPGMEGIDVLNVLKEDECLRLIPVVVMTTSSLTYDIEKSYNAGANSVIVKPMNFDTYVDIINLLIQYWFKTTKTIIYG